MAAITPDTTIITYVGDLKLTIARFTTSAAIDNGDTYASGITSVLSWQFTEREASGTDTPVRGESSGTFTFDGGLNYSGDLYIYSRGY